MKVLVPMIAVGALVALGLFGLLHAVSHPEVEPEDAWLDAWREMGLTCQKPILSTSPKDHLLFGDGRELVKGREFEFTELRRYVIENVTLQVVVFPGTDLVPQFPEGRHQGFRLKSPGSSAHLCRSGRNLLIVKTRTNGDLISDDQPVPKLLLEKLFVAFERTAARFP